MKIVLVGAPLSGKGSIAELIVKDYPIAHISTGDIFRELMQKDTPLALKVKEYMDKSILVPDDITCEVVAERLKADDCKNGYVLDGFPRTVAQAECFDKIEKLDKVIVIEEKLEKLLYRSAGRRICADCKKIFNLNREKVDKCTNCGGELIKRKDDNPETVTARYNEYLEKTTPVIDFYKKQGIVEFLTGGELNLNYASVKEILNKLN